ncbi:MAG: hypothetical protein HC812_17435 [Leptolyngbya sp. RL_3_1]|nr:hypothetical protein [Leptolyngbya sp. RL_3_1]
MSVLIKNYGAQKPKGIGIEAAWVGGAKVAIARPFTLSAMQGRSHQPKHLELGS